jgi:hypothetical protein
MPLSCLPGKAYQTYTCQGGATSWQYNGRIISWTPSANHQQHNVVTVVSLAFSLQQLISWLVPRLGLAGNPSGSSNWGWLLILNKNQSPTATVQMALVACPAASCKSHVAAPPAFCCSSASSSCCCCCCCCCCQVAIEGCCHGELDNIYATLAHLEKVEGRKVDLLICCGDFQV